MTRGNGTARSRCHARASVSLAWKHRVHAARAMHATYARPEGRRPTRYALDSNPQPTVQRRDNAAAARASHSSDAAAACASHPPPPRRASTIDRSVCAHTLQRLSPAPLPHASSTRLSRTPVAPRRPASPRDGWNGGFARLVLSARVLEPRRRASSAGASVGAGGAPRRQ